MNTKEVAKLRTQKIDKVKAKITFAKLWFPTFKEFNFRIMLYCLCSVPAIPVAREGGCSVK